MGIPRINLAETSDFDLGGLRVSPARRQVSMGGEFRELEPKVAQVLIALASASPAVVSRDRLVEQCWDGRIVGDDALNRCIVALRHLAKAYSPEPFAIETVPRVGYSLLAGPRAISGERHRRVRTPIAVALLLAIVVAIFVAFSWQRYVRAEAAPASIAVLPFRNLSAGDPYFAQGVGEEILSQLAREPQFRVAGSTSSSQVGKDSNVREAAQKLNVDYVVEGSVRRQGGQVRVNADLLRAKDGVRLWSDTFDGKLDDILQIQSAIGEAVANGLRRKLVYSAAAVTRPVNGEAYALYLNARGLLRSGIPTAGQDALTLLRQAIRVDPSFAPAWVSLGDALELDARTKGDEGMIAIMPEARNAVQHALQLDPNLAEAHAAYADLVGADSREGVAHLRRAAALSPRTSEGMTWQAVTLHVSGDFSRAYAAFQRAHDLDPLSSGPMKTIVDSYALAGNRAAAQSAINKYFPEDPMIRNFALARVAWFSGDFSEAARRLSAAPEGSRWASSSKLGLQNVLFMLKLSKDHPSRPPLPVIGTGRNTPVRLWMDAPPSPAEWLRRNRSSAAELVYRDENVLAAKLMLREGRAKELVSTYDSNTGLLGMRRGEKVGTCYLQNAAVVALALRTVGRNDESNEILRQADAAIRAAYAEGVVPTWLDDDAAGIWALQGDKDAAVGALERALRRGSAHATRTDLPKLVDEPALRSLRGYPKFEAVRAKYDAHYARERLETAQVLHIPAS
jgi:TolB-like protein/DNA-binding winged helix-turn-helix (wHTH) protein